MIEAILKIETIHKLVKSGKKHLLVTIATVAKKKVFILETRNVIDVCMVYYRIKKFKI